MKLSRRRFLSACVPLTLAGCTTHDAFRIAESVARGNSLEGALTSRVKSHATGWVTNPAGLARDLQQLQSLVEKITSVWGDEEGLKPGPKQYVKYTDSYRSRGVIDFQAGVVRVETLEPALLKQAIVTTLLSPADPRQVDLFSDKPVPLGDEPFLLNQITDHEGKAVRWPWRANRFADYLLANAVKNRAVKLADGSHKEEKYVEFPLLPEHTLKRRYRYSEYVERYARQYQLESALVYAIIETESHFNPYAVSWVPAYGLMQIVPKTAGRDAYQEIHGRAGTPSRDYLFNVENNIRMGCAYLHILQSRYLAGIENPLSREYCIIAAYNGGAGNVLRSFTGDRKQSIRQINQLSPKQVYQRLRSRMPHESRGYLAKVTAAKPRYS